MTLYKYVASRICRSPRLSPQLSMHIEVFAVPRIDRCTKKYAISRVESRPVLRFEIGAIFIASRTKVCKKIAIFRRFFKATRWVTVASKIGDREVGLCMGLHVSYIDRFVVPPVFRYLIGAEDVEICTF